MRREGILCEMGHLLWARVSKGPDQAPLPSFESRRRSFMGRTKKRQSEINIQVYVYDNKSIRIQVQPREKYVLLSCQTEHLHERYRSVYTIAKPIETMREYRPVRYYQDIERSQRSKLPGERIPVKLTVSSPHSPRSPWQSITCLVPLSVSARIGATSPSLA